MTERPSPVTSAYNSTGTRGKAAPKISPQILDAMMYAKRGYLVIRNTWYKTHSLGLFSLDQARGYWCHPSPRLALNMNQEFKETGARAPRANSDKLFDQGNRLIQHLLSTCYIDGVLWRFPGIPVT